MGLDEKEKPIGQHPKSDETTSKAHPKPVWMGILPAVTMASRRQAATKPVQSISGYMRSSYVTYHITGGFSLPEGARERRIQLFADDEVARGHLIGQIPQMWQLSQQQSSNQDS